MTWAYDWENAARGNGGNKMFVPMLHSLDQGRDTEWAGAVQSSGAKYLLGFNEPDLPGSDCQMDAGTAAQKFQQYMTPYAGQASLGTPAVTSSAADGQGLSWMSSFLSACGSCNIGFVAIHWYGCPIGTCSVDDDVSAFQSHVGDAIKVAGGKPLWITEFQRLGDAGGQVQFLQKVLPWLDSQSGVAKYAYFFSSEGYLTSGNGLSSIGQAYVA